VTAAAERPVSTPAFSGRSVLALVIVGLVALSALAVLSAYAPDLRGDRDPGAHALSRSAVGFKGALVMLQAVGAPVVVSRSPPRELADRSGVIVLTPTLQTERKELSAFPAQARTLIVLPKWLTAADPLRPGFVHKVDVGEATGHARALLETYGGRTTSITHRSGVTRPRLYGAGDLFAEGTYLPLDGIDRLQSISGDAWIPLLRAEDGAVVLARSKTHTNILVLADPDLLNTQGVARLDNARAGLSILNALRGGEGVVFDVTLAGYSRGRGLGRTLLEPPWLAGTLCAVLAGLLMGLHGLARFGAPRREARAFALGKDALVDNSAGLVRMARREAELAPAYADLTKALIVEAGGGLRAQTNSPDERWLSDLARLRGVEAPDALAAEAARAKTRDDLLAVARKLHAWRLEMTRERR
jgi:hypothetical protein